MQDGAKLKLKFVEGMLFREWDPIGVNDAFMASDEYDRYASELVSLSERDGFSEDAVTNFLLHVETERMGLRGNEEVARRVAKKLVDAFLE